MYRAPVAEQVYSHVAVPLVVGGTGSTGRVVGAAAQQQQNDMVSAVTRYTVIDTGNNHKMNELVDNWIK